MTKPLKERYQRQEGALIERAMKAQDPPLSLRKLAEKIGLSDGRVRQIVNGYHPLGRGQVLEVVGPAETVARLAQAVAVSPDELESAGRSDAADVLRETLQRHSDDARLASVALDARALKAELRDWIDASMSKALHESPPPPEGLYLWRQDVMADVLAERVHTMRDRISELNLNVYEAHQVISAAKAHLIEREGGDGDADSTEPGGSAAMSEPVSAADDELSAAKTGEVEEAGEFNG